MFPCFTAVAISFFSPVKNSVAVDFPKISTEGPLVNSNSTDEIMAGALIKATFTGVSKQEKLSEETKL